MARSLPADLEHRVLVRRPLRYVLNHVPMFHDSSFVHAKDIDRGISPVVRRLGIVFMQPDQVPRCTDVHDLRMGLGVFTKISPEKIDERLASVGQIGIVLDVSVTERVVGGGNLMPIEERVVEIDDQATVRNRARRHPGTQVIGVFRRRQSRERASGGQRSSSQPECCNPADNVRCRFHPHGRGGYRTRSRTSRRAGRSSWPILARNLPNLSSNCGGCGCQAAKRPKPKEPPAAMTIASMLPFIK